MHGRARRTGALLALVALAAAGCGGGDAKERSRERINAYTTKQNAVMKRLAPDVDQANRVYVAFSQGKLKPAVVVERLKASEGVIRDVRAEIDDLKPPAEARELQRRLERYLDETVDLAVQTRRLAGYQPAAQAALAPLAPVNRRLQKRLGETDDPAGQVRILRQFQTGLAGIITDLRAIEVPAVQAPAHRDQLRRLSRTRDLAVDLRRALTDQDAEQVAVLLGRFRKQASDRADSRRLTRQGLAAYAKLLDRLKTTSAAVRREQIRLFRSVEDD